ncbi:extracellular cellulase CelA/allergen Asp F7-like [Apiospora sp. TS-2023a]
MACFKFFAIFFIAFVAMVTAHSGSLTYNPFNGNTGACGHAINNGDSTVAVAPSYFTSSNSNNDPVCGKTVNIVYNGVTTSAQVWDKCTGCGDGDLDATPDLFKRIVGSTDPGRVSISWSGI